MTGIETGWLRRAALRVSATIICVMMSGCATHIPVVIEPAILAADFQSRSLNDARLRDFVSMMTHKPAPGAVQNLDLTTLTLIALYYHPDLEVGRSKIARAEAAIVTAGQIPNPELNATATLHTMTMPSPWTVGALINFLLETSGRREFRVAQADRLADAARLDLLAASWTVRGRVRSALIQLWAAEKKLRLLSVRKELQSDLVSVLDKQLVAGELTTLLASRERSALSQIRLSAEDANRQLAEARVLLATSLGMPASALQDAKFSFGLLETPPQSSILTASANFRREALLGRSDLQVLLAEYAGACEGVQLEFAKQFPNITLGPGYTFDQGDNLFSLGFVAELPIFNRNEGPIAEAEAKRLEVATRFNALQAQIAGEVDLAAVSYKASTKSLATADALHATEHERQQKTGRAFKAGEIDRQTFLVSELEFAAIDSARADTLVQNRLSIGLLEDALRRPLFDPGAMPWLRDYGATSLRNTLATR
jgi:outer membrane protein, heavy metal efflux system